MAQIAYTTPSAVAELMKSGKEGSFAIVDVRDEDYVGGHIRGAINVPSLSLDDKLDSLVTDLKGKDTVIFHCALSQQRGPFAARKYAERISSGSSGDLLTNVSSATDAPLPETAMGKQQVLVLRGGFIRFAESYKNDQTLVEDYNQMTAETAGH